MSTTRERRLSRARPAPVTRFHTFSTSTHPLATASADGRAPGPDLVDSVGHGPGARASSPRVRCLSHPNLRLRPRFAAAQKRTRRPALCAGFAPEVTPPSAAVAIQPEPLPLIQCILVFRRRFVDGQRQSHKRKRRMTASDRTKTLWPRRRRSDDETSILPVGNTGPCRAAYFPASKEPQRRREWLWKLARPTPPRRPSQQARSRSREVEIAIEAERGGGESGLKR